MESSAKLSNILGITISEWAIFLKNFMKTKFFVYFTDALKKTQENKKNPIQKTKKSKLKLQMVKKRGVRTKKQL